jgi:RNA polymerase sigma-70 factor (ECF subfamily)
MKPRRSDPPDFPASQLFLRRLAFHLVRDEALAEDLVQDTWAAWVAERPSGLAEPRAWLARVLRNRAFNAKRARERRARRERLAGRPESSAPETDGTLEAQTQLLEALRALDEPYRSTLVQRYYHDLSPKEIAERSGAPLNTVKARLARGLERLRAEMDRRYHGDRRAWCHWLTVLGAPAAPIGAPEGSAGASPEAAPLAGLGGGGGGISLLAWLAVAGVLTVGAMLRMEWGRKPRVGQEGALERAASGPVPETTERGERRVVAVASEEVRRASAPAERPRPSALPAPLLPASGSGAIGYASEARSRGPAHGGFDWPQYGGGADHDNYRERVDGILAPKVLWFVPGCAGQPTLEGGDLYTGGLTLARLEPETGEVLGLSPELLAEALQTELDPRRRKASAHALVEGLKTLAPGDPSNHTVAAAPLITRELVIARLTRDGSVVAFERELEVDLAGRSREVWRWDPGWGGALVLDPLSARVPLCLTDEGLVLVAQSDQLVALRATDGREVWRFSVNGRIEMVPAAAAGRVFFGTDRGLFVALSAGTGELLWRAGANAFGAASPVVARGRVLVAEQGGPLWRPEPSRGPFPGGRLRAYDASSGAEVWETALEGSRLTDLGLGARGDHALAGLGEDVARFELRSGRLERWKGLRVWSELRCAPAVVGKSLVLGGGARLSVHALLEKGHGLRWAFQLPEGAEVHDFVHSGKRVYVATSIGLFCLGDDPKRSPPDDGFVLAWSGDPRLPSALAPSVLAEDE